MWALYSMWWYRGWFGWSIANVTELLCEVSVMLCRCFHLCALFSISTYTMQCLKYCDQAWFITLWSGMIRHFVIQVDSLLRDPTLFATLWSGMIRYFVIQHDSSICDSTWFVTLWSNVIRHFTIQHDSSLCDPAQHHSSVCYLAWLVSLWSNNNTAPLTLNFVERYWRYRSHYIIIIIIWHDSWLCDLTWSLTLWSGMLRHFVIRLIRNFVI